VLAAAGYRRVVGSEANRSGKPAYDRWLLLGEKRNDVLDLWEVRRYGRDVFGDPDYVSIYGLKPRDWYARGVRILGRTAVECTRDRLASLIGRDVAAIALRAPCAGGSVVVDLFAGSGNTLHWIAQLVGARRGIGFELDDVVFDLARKNLSIAGIDIDMIHDSYERGLNALTVPVEELLVVFVAPPWGRALDERSGLDLRQTIPPVSAVVDEVTGVFGGHKLLFATQVYEMVNPDSLAELIRRFQWSSLKIYDLNTPGQNHGLLIGTVGWTP
jgi:hypothetical protein